MNNIYVVVFSQINHIKEVRHLFDSSIWLKADQEIAAKKGVLLKDEIDCYG